MPSLSSTKFVRLLQSFDESELKPFDTWLRSPWCNSNKNLIRLFTRLVKYYPDFDHPRLDKEKLFREVLPDGKFSHRRMNNLLSEGYLAAERFLVFQRFSKDESLQKGLLAEEFQGRHLDDWFFRGVEQETGRLEKKAVKDYILSEAKQRKAMAKRLRKMAKTRKGGKAQTQIKHKQEMLEEAEALEKIAKDYEELAKQLH